MIASPNDNAAPFRSRDRRGCRIGQRQCRTCQSSGGAVIWEGRSVHERELFVFLSQISPALFAHSGTTASLSTEEEGKSMRECFLTFWTKSHDRLNKSHNFFSPTQISAMIDSPDDNAATSKEQEGKSTRESVSCFWSKFQAMIASPNDNAASFLFRDRRGCRIGQREPQRRRGWYDCVKVDREGR